MKTITLSLDDEIFRRVSAKAAQLDTSVDALVRAALEDMTVHAPPVQAGLDEQTFARLKRQEDEVRSRIDAFSATDRLPRSELYARKR